MTVGKAVLAIVLAAIVLFVGSAVVAGLFEAATKKSPEQIEAQCIASKGDGGWAGSSGVTLKDYCRNVADEQIVAADRREHPENY